MLAASGAKRNKPPATLSLRKGSRQKKERIFQRFIGSTIFFKALHYGVALS
jgi:hypothetical protein